MKSILASFIIVLISGVTSIAQIKDYQPEQTTQKGMSASQMLTGHYSLTYRAAIRYNDYAVAKHALYNMLVENPQNDSILYTLSTLYFQSQQFASAALTANDIIARNPDHLGALEISANALSKLGAQDKALDAYESLYLKTDDFSVLYQIAFMQHEMGRYKESMANTDILLNKKEAEAEKVTFNISETEQKEFPIKVALLNLKGLNYKAQGNKAKAKEAYNQALELAPDFMLAKNNLADIDK